ncbi:MAG: tetratricopeptide repeat protein [Candidatus Electrothrix sp. AU1_5]|nr:tetratricopeptide repeat protein [Candidatus Electrothrix gigas]
MRDLVTKRWQNRIDPDQEQKKEILKKLIHYYEENLLSPDYILTDFSCRRLEQQDVPKVIISDLQSQGGLTQDELDNYSPKIIKGAAQEVSQEKREVYFPELIEYAFMADADNAVQRFYEEFDMAMDDGRPAYAGLLGSEAVRCYRRYGASPLYALEIKLRDVQHYIDSDKPEDINKALQIINSVNEQQKNEASWKDSLLFGQFTLWKGIAEFWQDKFDEAIDSLKEGWRIFITYDEQQDLVYLAENWIGYVYYRKADFIEAEYWMKISLEGLIDLLSKELDNKKRKRNLQQRIQYSLGNLAVLYRYTGRFIEAIRYAEMQLNIVQSLPRNKKEILRSLNTLSHVLAIAGRNIDARHYLEEAKKICKEIPDRLLGGRVYSNFCQLSYGTMEFAHMLECYRAEELHKAVENSHGRHVGEYIDYAKKAIQLLEKEPAFHKELADAYFSLGELYMMMPKKYIKKEGDKWELAKHAFITALNSARKSHFQYRIIDTLESLVTLYYFQSQTESLSLEQKKDCIKKQEKYQKEIEKDWKIQQYPNLAGRYELTQGDIHFDKALEFLKEEYPKADNSARGVQNLLKAFTHYAKSAAYKKKFNINRYYLMLRVIYNRLDKLVELTHPLTFPRLEFLDYQRQEEYREEPLISRSVLSLLAQNHATWETDIEDFRSFKKIFEYALLLGKKTIPERKLKKLEKELEEFERIGEYWKAVLVNKCLTELYWIQANISTDILKKEEALEQLVFHLNQQSRQYRLMRDSFHARRSYERAEKIIVKQITDDLLKKGLEGYTAIVKGEYFFQRVEFATLLESLVVGELKAGRKKFEQQFSYTTEKVGTLDKASEFFKKGIKLLDEALQGACRKNPPLHQPEQYKNKLSEAFFMLGELLILQEQFSEALDCFEKCMERYPENEKNYRLDDAKQSYLSAFYFSSGEFGSPERKEKYEQELEKKIQTGDYSRPWVAARLRITQGDILFSECYYMADKSVSSDFSTYKFIAKKEVERKNLVLMFRKYIEACNYKAGYNELSFEAGLRVLRRRIEMIPDSESLDILRDIFRQLWQDGEHLREKKEKLDSILQLIRMRSLVLQYEEE